MDIQIDRHEKEIARLPREVQDIARNLVALRRDLSETQEKLTASENDQQRREAELATEQEKIRKSEKRLLGIKNQKEFAALTREVKLGKKIAGEIEDALLGIMTEAETLKRLHGKKDSEYKALESSLLEKKAEHESVGNGAEEELEALRTQRAEIAAQIDRSFLKRYDTIRKARGAALAEVNSGGCTGCHLLLPPQLNIRVLKQEEFLSCPNCSRILFVRAENVPEHNKMAP